MITAQEWLNQNFPTPESKQSAREINASNKNLTGELKLIGFSNLERADFWTNRLTKIDISQCPQLTYLNVDLNPTLQERPLFFLAEWKKNLDSWKAKYQTLINQRKTQLAQEIQLIKEVLND